MMRLMGRPLNETAQPEGRGMTSQDTPQAILGSMGQGPLSIAMLQLCQISYFPFEQIQRAVNHLPPLQPGGAWTCIWGPAEDWIEANLAFIAAYYPTPGGPPMLTSVVIRGTDLVVSDPIGVAWQIWEDMDPTDQEPLPWAPNDPAAIAGGTLDGLQVIQSLSWHGITLNGGLAAFLAQPGNSGTLLTVTGHSLGGCLTTVVAPWLRTDLTSYSGSIIPVTFAAPTAGNPAFATYFGKMFSYSLRYQNPLDIVPLAYDNLSGMDGIYTPCGLTIPDEMYALLWCAEEALSDVTYVQPNSNAPPLAVQCFNTTSWFDEAAHQHLTTTYMNLLEGKSFGTLPRGGRRVRTTPTLRDRLGPLPDRLQKLRDGKPAGA